MMSVSHVTQKSEIIGKGKELFSKYYGRELSFEEAREAYFRLMELSNILLESNKETEIKHE